MSTTSKKQKLERHLKELPVVGFNSGKYDVNPLKVDFFAELVKSQRMKHTVKRNNNFMCIKTEELTPRYGRECNWPIV
jgi:hypothetical protein